MRTSFVLRSVFSLRDGAQKPDSQFWQAGKSVAAIHAIEPAGEIVRGWREAVSKA